MITAIDHIALYWLGINGCDPVSVAAHAVTGGKEGEIVRTDDDQFKVIAIAPC